MKSQNWLAHIQSKALHFDAAAQYRKSNEELENARYVRARRGGTQPLISHRYGQEISRLQSARKKAKEGSEIARKGGASASVLKDLNVRVHRYGQLTDVFIPALQSLLSTVENDIKRAERDNGLIYHQVPPSLTSLQPIPLASMVKSEVPSTLTDPQSVIRKEAVIFGELLAWGARKAIGWCVRFSTVAPLTRPSLQAFIITGGTASFPMRSLRTRRS